MERWLRIDELARMLYSVSEEKWAKVKKFRKLEDANRGLIGEILIRTIIRNKFNITNDQIVITTGPYGKPYAVGIPSFHFNIAHSGRWIVCAVDCEPVGIDIEEIKPVSFDIAKYFFSTEEYQWLMDKEEAERTSSFYDLWTLKESFVKQGGKGMSFPLNSFSIKVEANPTISVQVTDKDIPCFVKQLNVDPNYKMAICSATGNFPEQMILKRIDDFSITTPKE